MKKVIISICVIIIILLILFFPYVINSSKDGGSETNYISLVMHVTSYKPTELMPRQDKGLIITIFGNEVFNNVENYYLTETFSNYEENVFVDTSSALNSQVDFTVSSYHNLMPMNTKTNPNVFIEVQDISKNDYFDQFETVQIIANNSIISKKDFNIPSQARHVYSFVLNNYSYDSNDLSIILKEKGSGILYKKELSFKVGKVY